MPRYSNAIPLYLKPHCLIFLYIRKPASCAAAAGSAGQLLQQRQQDPNPLAGAGPDPPRQVPIQIFHIVVLGLMPAGALCKQAAAVACLARRILAICGREQQQRKSGLRKQRHPLVLGGD